MLLICMTIFVQQIQAKTDLREDMENYIQTLLVELKHAPQGSFLILNIKHSEKFVQFAGSNVEPLALDFPIRQLSRAQMQRAHDFFSSLNIHPEELELTAYPSGAVNGSIETYNFVFHKGTRIPAELTTDILLHVFGVTDPYDIIPEMQ